MPINSPNVFCSKVEVNSKPTVVSDNEFDSIGQINTVAGTPCTNS